MSVTDALALDGLDLVLGSIVSLLRGDDADESVARAKVVVTLGRVEALRLARSPDEFEAAFDLLAKSRFLVEIQRMITDPGVRLLAQSGRALELAGHWPAATDPTAEEYAADLLERGTLLAQLLAERHGLSLAAPSDAALEELRAPRPRGPVAADLTSWMVSVIGLTISACGPHPWPRWMTGLLWSYGRRAVVDLANQCEVSWESASDALTTTRDRRLMAEPYDQAASDEAASLLGLQ
jgi:hypothetical protein